MIINRTSILTTIHLILILFVLLRLLRELLELYVGLPPNRFQIWHFHDPPGLLPCHCLEWKWKCLKKVGIYYPCGSYCFGVKVRKMLECIIPIEVSQCCPNAPASNEKRLWSVLFLNIFPFSFFCVFILSLLQNIDSY